MRTFPASDLQRSAAEVQKAAALAPIVLTHHDKPRFVIMSLEDYARLSGAKLKASPENLPDSVVARLQGSADACVDDELGLVGDLEGYLNA